MLSTLFTDFWITLFEVLSGPRIVNQVIDIPLLLAVRRSKIVSAWVASLAVFASVVTQPPALRNLFALPRVHGQPLHSLVLGLVLMLSTAVLTFAIYGFLRLYTLVFHVMTLNIFKVRGQRLRLLNLEVTLMALSVPVAGGILVLHIWPLGGTLILNATLLYVLVLFGHGFNLIFHKRRIQGFLLFLGGTLVTSFVLFIGALAVTVSVVVIAFLVMSIFRPLLHLKS